MKTSDTNATKQFCDAIDTIANNFLNISKGKKSYLSKLFEIQSEEDKIAHKMRLEVARFRNNLSFPKLSFYEENKLFVKLISLYEKFEEIICKTMNHSEVVDKSLATLFDALSESIKKYAAIFYNYSLNREAMNCNYLMYYIANREIGFAIPRNYTILKIEAISALQNHLMSSLKSDIHPITIATLESLQNDKRGINKYISADTSSNLNLLQFINTFRLVLIDQNDNTLLPKITKVLDRALEIVRPDSHRTLRSQIEENADDIITKRIAKIKQSTAKNCAFFPSETSPKFVLKKSDISPAVNDRVWLSRSLQ